MGYSEIYCHFCGVSFNIARCRKPCEPPSAAWDYHGGPWQDSFRTFGLRDCARQGCSFCVTAGAKGNPSNNTDDTDDAVHDPDYVFKDEENDPYEYVSDDEMIDEMLLDEEQEDDGGENEDQDLEDRWYRDWLSAFVPKETFPGEPILTLDPSPENEVFIPAPDMDGVIYNNMPGGRNNIYFEHVPGPTCTATNGYSGCRISLEEMMGCRTAQCLVHKSLSGNWEPDGLEQAWELSADYFLSGLCDGIPSRDERSPRVIPARGGVDEPNAENITWEGMGNDYALPFHPWCFDIFSRLSKRCFDNINIAGLMKWRNAQYSYKDFRRFPRDPDVSAGQEQWWIHQSGKEYLAANPLYIPALPPLLLAAIKEDEDFSPQNGAFDLSQPTCHDTISSMCLRSLVTASPDPLLWLPQELRLVIISYLGSRDIANLRLASRAFRQIPISVWHRLIREEMPWLWEAWDESENTHTPSFWTGITANEMRLLCKIRERYMSVLTDQPPAIYLNQTIIDNTLPWPPAVPDQVKLPGGKTNWYEIYSEITRNWGQLKGLQNRRRIWKDIETIIRCIQKQEELTATP